jgi:hypothetical protein
MVYEVRAKNADGSESRFEFEREEPLKVGDLFNSLTMVYRVLRVLPDESNQYDAVVEARLVGGPAESTYIE